MTDWSTYLRCPYCFARAGRPCMTRTTAKYIAEPHPVREREPVFRRCPCGASSYVLTLTGADCIGCHAPLQKLEVPA